MILAWPSQNHNLEQQSEANLELWCRSSPKRLANGTIRSACHSLLVWCSISCLTATSWRYLEISLWLLPCCWVEGYSTPKSGRGSPTTSRSLWQNNLEICY
ncbi:hypothetical protein BJX65DRAFT_283175 [Aspergillus insuetus]